MSAPDPDEILEALDLARAEPGRGFLHALFSRFLARVPFETVSKILRDRDEASPEAKPRTPEIFWRDFLDWGAGGTCFARVAAFAHLLEATGFRTRVALGRIEADFDHAALWVSRGDGEEWIADVGFPLPALLPAAPGEHDTGLGPVRVSRSARGRVVELLEGVPGSARRAEILEAPVAPGEFHRHWRATFRAGSRFLSRVGLRLQSADRAVSFASGELRVDDRHTRLTIPLASPRAPRLEEVFAVRAEEIERAFAAVGDPDSSLASPSMTAWLEVEGDPDDAFRAIATAEGYRSLLDGVGGRVAAQESAGGWRLLVHAPGEGESAPEIVEEVTRRPDGRELSVVRRSGESSAASSWRVELHGGRTHLAREARPTAPPEMLLRNDSLRGRLAASLAVDLLAWARRL